MKCWQVVVTLALVALALVAPAGAGVVPDLNVTAVGGLGHEIRSGWHKPVLFVSETVLGPHYGPLYLGGVGLAQSQDGVTSTVVPLATYVAKGYIKGWFRGLAFQVGQRRQVGVAGTPGYYFLIGAAR